MALAPSTENYVLGKGRLFFNPLVSGANTGEVALGNAPTLSFSLAVEKLDHFSSLAGLRAKDKTVVTEVSPTLSFTLDEVNRKNLEFLVMGSTSTLAQTASSNADTELTAAAAEGIYYETGKRNIGVYAITYTGMTSGPALKDDTLEETASQTWSCTVFQDDVANGILYVGHLTGTPTAGDGIQEQGGAGWDATMVGSPVWTTDRIVASRDAWVGVLDTTDIIVNTRSGLIGIAEGGNVLADDTVDIAFAWAATDYYKVEGLQTTSLEGMVRFVSDNPVGTQLELRAWNVSLTPDGDTGFIGEDWSTISFTGEILKDEAGHPTSPYMDILIG